MATRRRFQLAIGVVAALFVSSVASESTQADLADLATAPVQLVDLTDAPGEGTRLHPSDLKVSRNGRYATLNVGLLLRDYVHLNLRTGELTDVALDRVSPSEDGQSVTGSNGTGAALHESVATGQITPAAPAVPDSVELPNWTLTATSVSADERFLLLSGRTSDNFLWNAFVWDLDAEVLVTPSTGLPSEAGRVASAVLNVRDGRQVVEYQTFSVVGAQFATFEILDLLSGDRTTIAPPDSWSPTLGGWLLSTNLEWILFASNEANVVPGLDAGPRYYRYDRTSGDIIAPPLGEDQSVLAHLRILDAGGVGFSAEIDGGATYLYVWPGDGPVVSLMQTGAGELADAGLGSFGSWSFSDSGETVLFTSWARDLVEGLDPDADVLRLYLIDASTDVAGPPVIGGGAEATAPAQRCALGGC